MKQRNARHVKIVCTLGPASSSPEVIQKLLKGGMDVARLNLAHGTLEEHAKVIAEVRSLSQELNLSTGILLDLPGMKHRSGDVKTLFGQHLEFACAQSVDFVALSFVSSPRQVHEVKELLGRMDAEIPVIVKIEDARALEQSASMLEVGEGIMVARGDLALDISIEKVPVAQKHLIREANLLGKPVITATQMLESMLESPTPTRAEATDVANAILDGSDALMLAGETAAGSYPVEALETMAKIALEAETAFPYQQIINEGREFLPEINDATARAACQMAHQVQAEAIVAFTYGGTTALRLSKYRPRQPILAVTHRESVERRLTLAWGVLPIKRPEPSDLDEAFEMAREVAQDSKLAKRGDLVIITVGLPLSLPGSTNLVKIHSV